MHIKLKKISLTQVFEIILLSFILNLSAVKIIANITSNAIIYFIFIVFATVVLLDTFKRNVNFNKNVVCVIFLCFVTAIISLLCTNVDAEADLFKFSSGIIVAYLASRLNSDVRIGTIKMSLFISSFYSLYLISNFDTVYNLFISSGRVNYLEVTLPIGLGLSFALVTIVMEKMNIKGVLFYFSIIVIYVATLLRYIARGNLIFPIIITGLCLFFANRYNVKKLLIYFIFFALSLFLFFNILLEYGNSLLVTRLFRMFEQVEQESRIPIYNYYIEYTLSNFNFIIGHGFGAAKEVFQSGGIHATYPHNFILELVGEMGLVGILLIFVVASEIIRNEKKLLNIFNLPQNSSRNKAILLFYLTNAGFMFYFFTFFKSYSIYDGYLFFIFIAFLLTPQDLKKAQKKNYSNDNNGD